MPQDNNRNTIIFVVAAALLLILYQVFVLEPQAKRRHAEMAAQKPAAAASAQIGAPPVLAPRELSRDEAAAASPRLPIDNGSLSGSLSLRGARIDDLYLDRYRQGLDAKSPPVELLRPEGTKNAWFVDFGWVGANLPGLPGPGTVWTVAQGAALKPGSPVILTHDTGAGVVFTRKIELDDRYMFTVTDTVTNRGATAITLAPYGSVQRQGVPPELGRNTVVHEGAVGWLGKELRQIKYPKWAKDGGTESFDNVVGGWTGITDKYWLAALIPSQSETLDAKYRVVRSGDTNIFEANYTGKPRVVPAGGQITETARLFAGAKTVPILRDYQDRLQISNFDNAVDWGMFRIITRPLFTFLTFIYGHIGNFGVSILVLTVVVRLAFFPLANKQYESVTKMKKIQPMMEEIKKTYKDDAPKQQQELMELYKREKINPLAGCLPLLFQIPVFYALYKVLTVTIEMRHAPFYGWIKDLSERDPTTIWNLFGAIPWDPSTAPLVGGLLDTSLHLGVLPLAYGATMWLSMSMSPPAGDPVQQRIFQFMPLMFTFIMAHFAVGLLIYWTWSNILTILQQYVIMRRFGVDNPIDKIIGKFSGKPRPSSGTIG